VVQDLVVRPHVTNFHCERWQTPDGKVVTASLPAGIDGHFGPELRRFVLAPYYQGQMTVSRLVTLLRSLGIFISKRQLVRLLNTGRTNSSPSPMLRAGLSSADWITVDDSGRTPQSHQRLLHTDWQRPLHLVRQHGLQEPPQLP
jgi:hypothetical protein